MNTRSQKFIRFCLLGVAALLGSGRFFSLTEAAAVEATQPLTNQEKQIASQINNIFRRAASLVTPAVVYIRAHKNLEPTPYTPSLETIGVGSGFIVDKSGYVLTNNHVVEDTEKVEIVLADGQQFEAVEKLYDPETDLALVRIEPQGQELPVVTFGDSDQAAVGDFVIAIGNPFGARLSQTVTAGIISYKGRQTHVLGKWGYEDFIQTDADINKGNSGGPLVNVYGEVIGINSNIYSPTGVSTGYGFAVPSNMAKYVVDKLIKHKRVPRGWLGIQMTSLQDLRTLPKEYWIEPPEVWDENMKQFIQNNPKLLEKIPPSLQGVIVTYVDTGDPAEQAGVQAGDVIVQVDKSRITQSKEIRDYIAQLEPDKTISLDIWRHGEEKTLQVTLGDRAVARRKYSQEENEMVPYPYNRGPYEEFERSRPAKLGIRVHPLTPKLAKDFGYNKHLRGVIIISVSPDSIAEQSGLKAGDLIVTVDGTRITGNQEGINTLKEIIDKTDLEEEGVEFVVRTRQGDRVVIVKRHIK